MEEEFCKFLRKWDVIKNYADFMRYYTYLNFIWKEKIIYLTGEDLLMEELRYSIVTE